MTRPSDKVQSPHRALSWGPSGLLLGAALLASIGLIASSCARAFDLEGYNDAFGSACKLADRCYGPLYAECGERFERIATGERSSSWLMQVDTTGCLDSCNSLYRCLDFDPLCIPHITAPAGTGGEGAAPEGGAGGAAPVIPEPCTINEDCCGYSEGSAACRSGLCCVPTGVGCGSDYDCCTDAGKCTQGQGADHKTCGGVVCALKDEACLNSFQCCSGRCEQERCAEIPCPPEGFQCEKDSDCCDLQCLPDLQGVSRCTHPVCAQEGEPCTTAADCCTGGSECFKGMNPNAPSGVCSSSGPCLPDEADCTGNEQGAGSSCCSGYCHPQYHLCGKCVEKNAPCSEGVPCCAGTACHNNSCQCLDSGESCVEGVPCCSGAACDKNNGCP